MNSFVIVLGLLSPSLANLVLKDGAYSGVQVRIGEGAPVGDCTQILKSLQVNILQDRQKVRSDKAESRVRSRVRRGQRKPGPILAVRAELACDP